MYSQKPTEWQCWRCDKYIVDDYDCVASVWDDHSYCLKCLNDVDNEYTSQGYKYIEETNEVVYLPIV